MFLVWKYIVETFDIKYYYDIHFASTASPSAFFDFFLGSRSALVTNSLSSWSSKVLSDLTNSGLYHNGGWVSNSGPAGRRAMVKWNAATKVFDGVYLYGTLLGERNEKQGRCHLHYFIWLDQVVLHGFLQTQASTLLIIEASDVEWECSCFLLDFREDSP